MTIVAVHTPEFEFEKKYYNVVEAAGKHGIEYPIVQDNEFTTWRAFNNRYWPAKYLIDSKEPLNKPLMRLAERRFPPPESSHRGGGGQNPSTSSGRTDWNTELFRGFLTV